MSVKASHLSLASAPKPATDDYRPEAPLSATDFASLFDISPYLLVQSHVAAVERLYAIASSSDEASDDDDESSDEESGDADDEKAEELVNVVLTTAGSAALLRPASIVALQAGSRRDGHRSVPGRPRSSSSVSNSAKAHGLGRDKFVIDPSMIPFPWGHPDVVPRPRLRVVPGSTVSGMGTGVNRSPAAMAARALASASSQHATPQLSPKALRAHLFPDSDGGIGGSGDGSHTVEHVPASPSNNTSTDGTESDEAPPPTPSHMGTGASMNGGRNGRGGPAASAMHTGRKGERGNWEVVDSVRLLDGIL